MVISKIKGRTWMISGTRFCAVGFPIDNTLGVRCSTSQYRGCFVLKRVLRGLRSNKTPVCSLVDCFVLRNGITEQTVRLFCFVADRHFSTSGLPVDGHILTTVPN
jgi:hypothetical protein